VAWVTDEQLKRARLLPALDYILRYEADNYKQVGNGYRLRADNALAVDKNGWYCHKRHIGSKTALDYLVEIKGYGLVDAVCTVLGERPQEHSNKPKGVTSSINPMPNPTPNTNLFSDADIKPTKRAPFALPLRHKDNKRVIAYLQSRGIDRDSVLDCIEQGMLFESKYYHNCVFLGKDEQGKTRFAAMRSTTTKFMRDADGSDKKYGFILPPNNPGSHEAAIFESPIDCLSHQTLCKQGYIQPFDGWRISLGGTSILALEHFLEQHPNIKHCIICTDADEAGDRVAVTVGEIPNITTERSTPTHGIDWNDVLVAARKAERTQNRARDAPSLH